MSRGHFHQRAVERFGVDDPETLFRDIRKALMDVDKWSDYIKPVVGSHKGGSFYRIRLSDSQEIAYVAARNGHPLTIYTQSQMRDYKAARKGKVRRSKLRDDARLATKPDRG